MHNDPVDTTVMQVSFKKKKKSFFSILKIKFDWNMIDFSYVVLKELFYFHLIKHIWLVFFYCYFQKKIWILVIWFFFFFVWKQRYGRNWITDRIENIFISIWTYLTTISSALFSATVPNEWKLFLIFDISFICQGRIVNLVAGQTLYIPYGMLCFFFLLLFEFKYSFFNKYFLKNNFIHMQVGNTLSPTSPTTLFLFPTVAFINTTSVSASFAQ